MRRGFVWSQVRLCSIKTASVSAPARDNSVKEERGETKEALHAVPGECTGLCCAATVSGRDDNQVHVSCRYKSRCAREQSMCVCRSIFMCAGTVGCYKEPTVVPEKRSCFEMNKHGLVTQEIRSSLGKWIIL